MANRTKLEVYLLRIRDYGQKDNYHNLDTVFSSSGFLQFFQDYIKSFDHQLEKDENTQRSLKLSSGTLKVASSQGLISGIIESGDYGYEGDGYNMKTGNKSYTRSVDDTEIKPFYFLLNIPKNKDKGFIIIQRLGVYGIHGIFKKHITNHLKTVSPNLQLDFEPFVSKELAQKFIENGGITQFSMVRYNLPSDVVEKLGMSGHQEDILSLEVTIKAKRKGGLALNNRVKKFVDNPNARIFSVRQLDDLGFDGDHKTKLRVKLGGNKRTIDLSDTGQIRPYYDIDKEVVKDKSGHPNFASIDSISKGLLGDLKREIGYGDD